MIAPSLLFSLAILLGLLILSIQRAKHFADFALIVVVAYTLVVFGVRAVWLIGNPDYLATRGLAAREMPHALAIVSMIATLGCLSLSAGWFWSRKKVRTGAPSTRGGNTKVDVRGPIVLLIALLELGAGGYLILSARSLAQSGSSSIRADLSGSLYPLFAIWLGNSLWIAILSLRRSRRIDLRLVALAVSGLGFGAVVSFAVKSRGSAVPPLVAALLIWVTARRKPIGIRLGLTKKLAVGICVAISGILLIGYAESRNSPQDKGIAEVLMSYGKGGRGSLDPLKEFGEVDAFAYAYRHRSSLPSSFQLLKELVQSPLLLVPRFFGFPKPIPYDYHIREAVFAGTARTGLPASVFGELWLLASTPGVLVGSFLLGATISRQARRFWASQRLRGQVFSALVIGHVYLIFSRPLAISTTRLLAYFICVQGVDMFVIRRRSKVSDVPMLPS